MASRRELDVLSEIQDLLLHRHKNVQDFLKQVLRKANTLIGSDVGYIGLIEGPEPRSVVLRYKNFVDPDIGTMNWRRVDLRFPIGGEDLSPEDRSFTGYVAFTRQMQKSGDVTKETFYRASHPPTQSELAVPILLDEEVLGIINLESHARDYFTTTHEKILKLVAQLIAHPLDSLMTREGVSSPLRSIRDKIGAELSAVPPGVSLETRGVLNRIAEHIAKETRSESCTIWLVDDTRRELELKGAYGPHQRYVDKHREKPGKSPAWYAIEQRCAVRYGQGTERRFSNPFEKLVYKRKLKSPLIVVPLLGQDAVIGVIKVGLREPTRENPQGNYTLRDEQLLGIIQGQIAAAVEEKRSEAERRQEVLEQLASQPVAKLFKVFEQMDLKTVLDVAAQEIPEICGGRHCSIFLWDENRRAFVLTATKGLSADLIGKAAYDSGEGLTGWVGQHGKSLLLDRRTLGDLKKIHPNLAWKQKFEEIANAEKIDFRPFLAVPILRYGQAIGIIRISDRQEGFFTESNERIVTVIASHIATVIAYCERYEKRIKLLKQMQAMMEHTRDALREFDTHPGHIEKAILEGAQAAAEGLGADNVILYRFNDETRAFEMPPLAEGKLGSDVFMNYPPSPDTLPWDILNNGTKYFTDAHPAATDSEQSRDLILPLPSSLFVQREKIHSLVGLRLTVGQQPVGVLFLNFREGQFFGSRQREVIEIFADQLAVSLETAKLYRKLKESASREEAEHSAQELHDAILQILFSEVVSRAGSARAQFNRGNLSEVEHHLRIIEKAGQYCEREIRGVMGLLRDRAVDATGLEEAIKEFVNEWKDGLAVIFHVTGDTQKIPVSIQRHLYRVTQAVFYNVVRWAQARTATVHLGVKPDEVLLEVEDDGIGFDPSAVVNQKGKYGLQGSKDRVKGLGGKITICSHHNLGTKVRVTIPLNGMYAVTV
jgi:signal transduction histidine kinase/putative methionine-R-sulfoxide reductase with GAF domain